MSNVVLCLPVYYYFCVDFQVLSLMEGRPIAYPCNMMEEKLNIILLMHLVTVHVKVVSK